MVADTLWLPGSTCGERCFDENPQVSTGRAVVRVAAAASVLTAAVAVAPLVAALPDRLRAPVLRTFARTLLAAFGIRHDRRGRAPRAGELLVANHVSWVDVLVMMAHTPSRLLAKHDVATWPVI